MIIGMAFSPTFAYIVTDERLNEIISDFSVALQFLMIIVFINLGAPLDFHLILCAGVFTLVYILSIAVGKYTGAFMGAKITGLADTVQKYLGFTLLTHLGVSLVFTGIAVTSVSSFDIDSAIIIQGTIAAAVISEIIAVIVSKNVFEWADEFQSK